MPVPFRLLFLPMLLTKVKETIKKYGMLDEGHRVLVAVSGGPDSVCLLDVLRELSPAFGISLHVAHLDHMFRGEESAAESRFVAGLAEQRGIPATIEKRDVPAFCRERGMSAQAGARLVRYDFLRKVARETGALRIATGHTASDQAETLLMRLIRGAGLSGLAAIPPKRDAIIRPLITATRKEVMEHLGNRGISFMTDPSNQKPLYTRNRIRRDAMPVLASFNPRIIETLASEAELLRDENEAIEAHLTSIMDDVITCTSGALTIKRNMFNALPTAFRRRALKRVLDRISEESLSLSFIQIDEALNFIAEAQTGRSLRLSGEILITREYDEIAVGGREETKLTSVALSVPGLTAVDGLTVESAVGSSDTLSQAPAHEKNYRWQAEFDYDKIVSSLTIRNRRRGDWFCPSGMGGKRKKLQDYFTDEKVPQQRRDRIPLLCAGDDILWVIGFRTDERFLPGPGTKKVLVVAARGRE